MTHSCIKLIRWYFVAIVAVLAVLGTAFPAFAQTSSQSVPAQTQDKMKAEPPSPLQSPRPLEQNAVYHPITGDQRLKWFAASTVGPTTLIAGIFSAGIGTALDRPHEYGPGWEGFGDRYGMRLTGVSTGNAIEASFGALWGEDPRYFRVPDEPFKARLGHVIKLTFLARRRDGHYAPAYARYIATPGNNFLSNTWRVDSEANTDDALLRTLLGFAGRMGSNAFAEFSPDIRRLIRHN